MMDVEFNASLYLFYTRPQAPIFPNSGNVSLHKLYLRIRRIETPLLWSTYSTRSSSPPFHMGMRYFLLQKLLDSIDREWGWTIY